MFFCNFCFLAFQRRDFYYLTFLDFWLGQINKKKHFFKVCFGELWVNVCAFAFPKPSDVLVLVLVLVLKVSGANPSNVFLFGSSFL